MCGIAGLIDPRSSLDERRGSVQRMMDAMQHRGPDDAGLESNGATTLGMRRLAIFDPANGHQPMVSSDARFTIVFNGAIYNFHELRRELESVHWTFRTNCDTEVLLAAYARWGADCLNRLRGMFAFAVWDAREQTLFLARDPFGIKPLYYRHDGARLIFASELNALLASGTLSAEIDPESVADYLAWLAVPAPRTIYRGLFSLKPGDFATFHEGELRIETAWSFRTIPASIPPCRTRTQFVGELRERLEDTVRAHVIADVPVGAFLSGGLDSAAVTGLMTRVSGSRLRTFSIAFAEAEFSEAAEAEATARHFGTEHHATVLTGVEVARDMEKLLHSFDQPTGDGINTYYASRAARRGGVTVALSGLGGDELFGGYPSFRDTPRLARWLPAWRALPRSARSIVVQRLKRGDTRRRKLADVLEHARNIHEVGSLQRRVFSQPACRTLLAGDAARTAEGRPVCHPALDTLARNLQGRSSFDLVSAWELRTYMADVLLRDSDVMSMRHSLELRVPLVDRPLIEWLAQQPAEFKTDSHHPKSTLTEAVRDMLPPGLAERRKQGFTLPFARWMKDELRPFLDETFADASLDASGLFNRSAAQELWRGFLAGHDIREWSRVWSLAVLVSFVNRPSPSRTAGKAAAALSVNQQAAPSVAPRSRPPRAPGGTLFLAPAIFQTEGGIPRILQTYLKALCELSGPQRFVRMVALNDVSIAPDHLRRSANDRLEEWIACSRNKVRFVRETIRLSRGCDEIICGHLHIAPAAWLARQFNPRLRYYIVAHGIEVWRHFSARERLALRGAHRILCVSDFTRRELLKYCPLPEGRAVVLHNALDPTFVIAAGEPLRTCPPVILVVTRLTYDDRYKGVEDMIKAMPQVRAAVPGVRLRIIGRGDDVPRLKSLSERSGAADVIEFTGFVDDQRLAQEMSRCRMFALPSRKEGFGLVFLEAMARGRPCLGARAGGIPEVITEHTGMLIEYGNVAEVAAACISILQRDWDEERILDRARQFSFSAFQHQLARVLTA